MYQEKTKRVRLKGAKLKALYDAIYDRDSGQCAVCGRPIEYGVKFHHEPCGIYRSDEIEKGCMLCEECHYRRHHTGEAATIRGLCEAYLHGLYGEKGAKKE